MSSFVICSFTTYITHHFHSEWRKTNIFLLCCSRYIEYFVHYNVDIWIIYWLQVRMNRDFVERTTKTNLGYRYRSRSSFFHGLQQKMPHTDPVRITPISHEKNQRSYYTRFPSIENFTQTITDHFFAVSIPLDTKYWSGQNKNCMSHRVKGCERCEIALTSIPPIISWKIMGVRYNRAHIIHSE